ncbi:hypothetical protein HR060_07090 [Catenovulum sp. SM1970]|uniref:hypothetical protein n=1 Tax=Marinifaba aquimaris TaxID=2741323 RepID=UPI001574325C|nr:hypothetical protein [Marinifaba aquimaris]NTS76632.1 hypothetical protein [Marinifaba aquimaris]
MKKLIVSLFVLFTAFSSQAAFIEVNASNYIEFDFEVKGNNGVFDNDVNSLTFLWDYSQATFSDWSFVERVEIYNGNTLLSSVTSGLGVTLYDQSVRNHPRSMDFSAIHDGSIDGKVKIFASYPSAAKSVEFTDFFGWTLDVCDPNDFYSCNYAQNSYISMGNPSLQTVNVNAPASLGLFALSVMALFAARRKN